MKTYTKEEIAKFFNAIETYCTIRYPQDKWAAKSGIFSGMTKAFLNDTIEQPFIDGIIEGRIYSIEQAKDELKREANV